MSISKFGVLAAFALAAVLVGQTAEAQRARTPTGPATPKIALTTLTAQGYEIKAAISSGGNLQLVFLQKGKDAYACITAHLSDSEPWKSDCYPMQ